MAETKLFSTLLRRMKFTTRKKEMSSKWKKNEAGEDG